MRDIEHLTPQVAAALLAVGVVGCAVAGGMIAGCAGAGAASSAGAPAETTRPAPSEAPGARDALLAGARCKGGPNAPCACRELGDHAPEDPPPDEGHKRFEIRMWADDGSATLDSTTWGHFSARNVQTCYYVDVVPGTTSNVVFTAKESWPRQGMGPVLAISEYGPKGPWWYRILEAHCAGPNGHCNRDAADDWGKEIKTRQRGRIDPCGSTVITRLKWDTSGGSGDPELGLFRDFTVSFTMEVKHFPTQFAPGSTECIPK